jgi:hypothetical protein
MTAAHQGAADEQGRYCRRTKRRRQAGLQELRSLQARGRAIRGSLGPRVQRVVPGCVHWPGLAGEAFGGGFVHQHCSAPASRVMSGSHRKTRAGDDSHDPLTARGRVFIAHEWMAGQVMNHSCRCGLRMATVLLAPFAAAARPSLIVCVCVCVSNTPTSPPRPIPILSHLLPLPPSLPSPSPCPSSQALLVATQSPSPNGRALPISAVRHPQPAHHHHPTLALSRWLANEQCCTPG